MKVTLPGIPIPQARPRFSRRSNYYQVYDLNSRAKQEIGIILQTSLDLSLNGKNNEIVQDAFKFDRSDVIHVKATFTLPIPRNLNRSEINAILWGFSVPNVKPDLDNLLKFILDCGNSILWYDDAQIVSIDAKKKYGKNPNIMLEIIPMSKNDSSLEISQKILCEFSPAELALFLADAAKYYELSNSPAAGNIEGNSVHVQAMAKILSRIASFGPTLNRINKKYPNFHLK